MARKIRNILFCGCTALLLVGCASIGPKTINTDQYNYNIAINKGLNEQMLLNLVQMRYGDSPMFLRISSVVNSYSVEEQVSALGSISLNGGSDTLSLTPFLKYTDRPTITYVPLTGVQFAKSLLVPIPDSVILSFIDMGWSADLILRLCLRSINGIENREFRASSGVRVDPEFVPFVEAFRRLQEEKAIRTWYRNTEGGPVEFMRFENRHNMSDVENDISLVIQMLGLAPGASEYRVGFTPDGRRDSEVEIKGRSLYEILAVIASEMHVPAKDVERNVVLATPEYISMRGGEPGPLIGIHSSPERPTDGFVSIRYRGSWFWIDDGDYLSKKIFSVLMGLFMITESGAQDFAPILTIPAG